MRPADLIWPFLGLLYAAGAGWLLYDFSGEAANLLRGGWLKDSVLIQSLWPGAERAIPVNWLHDLRIVAVPVYVALGLWLAERIWKRFEMLKGSGGGH